MVLKTPSDITGSKLTLMLPCGSGPMISYGALTTDPDLMQLVQTAIFLTLPLEIVRTRCKFGLNLRLVRL